MASIEIIRARYARCEGRYASDCTDAEWAIVEPFAPSPCRAGRPRKTNMRGVWTAIQYRAATGCRWAMLAKDVPPFTTAQHCFYRLRDSGARDLLNEALVAASHALPLRRTFTPIGSGEPGDYALTSTGRRIWNWMFAAPPRVLGRAILSTIVSQRVA
jgi:transposase